MGCYVPCNRIRTTTRSSNSFSLVRLVWWRVCMLDEAVLLLGAACMQPSTSCAAPALSKASGQFCSHAQGWAGPWVGSRGVGFWDLCMYHQGLVQTKLLVGKRPVQGKRVWAVLNAQNFSAHPVNILQQIAVAIKQMYMILLSAKHLCCHLNPPQSETLPKQQFFLLLQPTKFLGNKITLQN